MRLFVAIDVPQTLKDVIEGEIVETLRDRIGGAKWTRPESRHLTLKFLGNVADDRVEEIVAALRTAAARHSTFSASFSDVGGFPNLRRPRVLWVGIGEGAEPMAHLAADVEHELEGLGFPEEGRPFRGHFTLARFPRPRVIELPDIDVPPAAFDVEEVVLFQSRLHPKGAQYTALERFRFT